MTFARSLACCAALLAACHDGSPAPAPPPTATVEVPPASATEAPAAPPAPTASVAPPASATPSSAPSQVSSTDANCTDPRPGPGWTCARNCGPPVVRPGTPDPGWSWLAPGKRRICPICLPADARIATPEGDVAASDVRAGMRVWTADARGARVPGVVLRVGSASAPRGHALVELTLADGRRVRASGGHPTAEGRPFDAIAVGDAIGGVRVVQVARIPYGGNATFDLLPSGETGTYWADGVLVGSTLR